MGDSITVNLAMEYKTTRGFPIKEPEFDEMGELVFEGEEEDGSPRLSRVPLTMRSVLTQVLDAVYEDEKNLNQRTVRRRSRLSEKIWEWKKPTIELTPVAVSMIAKLVKKTQLNGRVKALTWDELKWKEDEDEPELDIA